MKHIYEENRDARGVSHGCIRGRLWTNEIDPSVRMINDQSNLISPDAGSSSNRVTFSLRRDFRSRVRVRLTTGGRDVIKMYFGLCAGGGARHSGIAFSSRVLHLLTITALPKTLLTRMLNASRF